MEKFKTKEEVSKWLTKLKVKRFQIEDDLTVNVNGSVYLQTFPEHIYSIPVQFGKVTGNFDTCQNSLSSLKGCPWSVGKNFSCDTNLVTSLKYCPQKVGGSFSCNSNLLTSLEYFPQNLKGSFSCNDNKLTSLVGAPFKIRGSFSCYENQLTSLYGCSEHVGKNFNCSRNLLSTLQNGPTYVGGFYDCSFNGLSTLKGAPLEVLSFRGDNTNIVSLVGSPALVKSDFHCCRCQLTTLIGAPKFIGGSLICYGNNIDNLEGTFLHVVETLDLCDNPMETLGTKFSAYCGEFKFGDIPNGVDDDFHFEEALSQIFPSAYFDNFGVLTVSGETFNETVRSINERRILSEQLTFPFKETDKNATEKSHVLTNFQLGQSKTKFKL